MMLKRLMCLVLVTGLLSTLWGCSKPDAKPTNEIIVKQEYIGSVPVVKTYKDDGTKKPVVFMLHGYGESKSFYLSYCQTMAEKGYYAVTMDAYGHGERTGGELLNFAQVVSMYPKDIEAVVQSIKDDPQADVYNMGMSGVSMGAMATFMYSTYAEIKPKAIAPIIGTPDLNQLKGTDLSRAVYDKTLGIQTSSMPQQEIDSILESSSPYKDYMNLKDIGIFMQNGEDDYLIVSDGCKNLYKDLKEAGAQNVELIMYPGMQHEITQEYLNKTMIFFGENLS